jgi:hypothetical protein
MYGAVTESPINRPQKLKRVLFGQKEASYAEGAGDNLARDHANP